MQMDMMWQEYGMDELEKGMQQLFPDFRISAAQLLGQLLQGDVLGAAGTLVQEVMRGMGTYVSGIKNILIWLIVLGILSALLIHFVEVFDKHQIADLSFYFIYLLMGVILLQCFFDVLQTARDIMENIILFVKLMVPTYLLAVGVASGPATVSAGYQLMLLLIYGTEKILLGVVLPLIYSYSLLNLINGIWVEEKLALLTDLLDTEGVPGSGHGDQRVPVTDHTGIRFCEDFRSGKSTFRAAGDRKCGRWDFRSGGGLGSGDPQQYRCAAVTVVNCGMCRSPVTDSAYCGFHQRCGSFYRDCQ